MHTPDWFSSVMPGPGVALQSHVKALVRLTLIFKSTFSFSMHITSSTKFKQNLKCCQEQKRAARQLGSCVLNALKGLAVWRLGKA